MPYFPSARDQLTVEKWARAGIGKERIAKRIGVSVAVLEQTYPLELGYTDEESLANVAEVAYMMAVSGKHPTMTKFWLEARGGWIPGSAPLAGDKKKPLTIIIDGEAIEGEFTEVEESTNVVELHPEPND